MFRQYFKFIKLRKSDTFLTLTKLGSQVIYLDNAVQQLL